MATVKTIFLYYNNLKKYYLNWDSDVDIVKCPLPGDAFNRIFYTENGLFRVTDKNLLPLVLDPTITQIAITVDPAYSYLPCPPAPGVAPVASGTVLGSDPTLIKTRGYVYTFVNGYGEEGPPSPVSNLIDVYDGNTVSITGMETTGPTGYNVQTKRIYRINQGAGSSAQFQFLVEIPLNQATFTDTILDSSLGEILPSSQWESAPSGIKGIIALPNQVLVGFVNNFVCFSEPKYPHAWPVRYQKPLDEKIIGLGAYGTTVIVLTEGRPYAIVGDNPANSVGERIDVGLSCISKRGILNINGVTIYPSPEGLVGIGARGIDLLTSDLLAKEQWELYNPSSIFAYYWENKYLAFYDTGVKKAGFIFDPKTKDFVHLDRRDPSYSFYYATAGYHDGTDGTLYLQIGDEIKAFDKGTSYRWINYLSKRFKTKFWCPGVVKVIAREYPVSIDIVYPTIPHTIRLSVSSNTPVRIPPCLIDFFEIRVFGTNGVSAIFLASTMEEIPV